MADPEKSRRRVTSVDVARAAGVSQSVVSRAFTPGATVSPATRKHVLAVARRLGYQPNAIAKGLVTQRSDIIGIIMGDIDNPFYPQILMKLAERLQSAGKQALLLSTRNGQDLDETLLTALRFQVEAVVIVSITLSSNMVRVLKAQQIPVILFNRTLPDSDVLAVACDNYAGGRLAAERLLEAGHQRLAYIGGEPDTSTNRERERGFVDVLGERGLTPHMRVSRSYIYDWGREAVREAFRNPTPPDALFCANDIIAIGALDTLRLELGTRVPQEVSVIGFDDIKEAAWASYALTTIRQPVEGMIELTVKLLAARLGGDPLPDSPHLLPGVLVERGSLRRPEES